VDLESRRELTGNSRYEPVYQHGFYHDQPSLDSPREQRRVAPCKTSERYCKANDPSRVFGQSPAGHDRQARSESHADDQRPCAQFIRYMANDHLPRDSGQVHQSYREGADLAGKLQSVCIC
jgi:hypothetical protein